MASRTRELVILGLAAEGARVVEIADRLLVSPSFLSAFAQPSLVRDYLSAVIARTGAHNRVDAIRIVHRDGGSGNRHAAAACAAASERMTCANFED
jgi:DNA-binding NarL/FixJ family response regulator